MPENGRGTGPVAVIGAGLAGLSAARELERRGLAVRVFDKGRGPGGRLSTRRAQTPLGELRFDHGAPWIRPAQQAVDGLVQEAIAAGRAARWEAGDPPEGSDAGDGPRAYCGRPAMNDLVKHAAQGLDARFGMRATRLEGAQGAWQVQFEDGARAEGPFGAVLVAVPAVQAADLLEEPAPALAEKAARSEARPTWTLMAAYPPGADIPGTPDVLRPEAGPLELVIRNSAKPGRGSGGAECWVAHATERWSRARLEDTAEDVGRDLSAALREALGRTDAPAWAQAHRWRYAQTAKPLGAPFAWDAALGLGLCGDWCLGPHAGDAVISGGALAEAAALSLQSRG